MIDYVIWEVLKMTLPYFIAIELIIIGIIYLIKRSEKGD
jgi:hypothetical protein